MRNQRLAQMVASVVAALLTFLSCGQAAVPTATTAPAKPTPTPGAQPTPAPSAQPSPGTTAAIPAVSNQYSAYTADQIKEYLAGNFYVPGMQFGQGQDPQYGGQLTASTRADYNGNDAYNTGDTTSIEMLSPVYGDGTLLRPKPSNNIDSEPYIAESWTTDTDFTEWTFKLRKDVKWHDDVPLTAKDVKFWVDNAVFPLPGRRVPTHAQNMGYPKEAHVIDDYTVKLVYKNPSPHLLETLFIQGNYDAVPQHLVQKKIDAGNMDWQPADWGWVGFGPFKMDRYEKASSMRLVRNDRYFEKDSKGRTLPYLDSLYFAIITDRSVAVSALRAGRIDRTSNGTGHHVTPDDVAAIKRSLGDKAWFFRLPYLGWGIGFQATKPPFDNVRLRQAINLYADRQQQIKLVYGGFGLQNAMLTPGTYWWNPETLKWPGYNPATKKEDQARALELVKESGLAGTEAHILCKDVYLPNCEFADLTLRGLGLNSKIDVVSPLDMVKRTQDGNFQLTITSYSPDLPNQLLLTLLTTNPIATTKTTDTKIDEYYKQIVATIDPAERRKITWEAERYVSVDQAYGFTFSKEEAAIAWRTYVKGQWVPMAHVQDLNDMRLVWIDKSLR